MLAYKLTGPATDQAKMSQIYFYWRAESFTRITITNINIDDYVDACASIGKTVCAQNRVILSI